MTKKAFKPWPGGVFIDRHGDVWLTKLAAQKVTALGESQIDRYRVRLPDADRLKHGRRVLVRAVSLHAAIVAAAVTEAKRRRGLAGQNGDADPLMDGEQSPALERYREARAKIAELDAAERAGALCSLDNLQQCAGVLERELGRALERAAERGDGACLGILENFREAAISGLEELIAKSGGAR